MIPMYQVILVLILYAIIAYDKEEHDFDFGVLLVPSVLHLGVLFWLYQGSSVPYENAVLYGNLSIFVLGLVAYANIFDYWVKINCFESEYVILDNKVDSTRIIYLIL